MQEDNRAEDIHRSIRMTLAPEFFYDANLLFDNEDMKVEEIRAYSILLGSNVESFLKVATLVDGSTVDFLFGSKTYARMNRVSRSRANDVKKFIRSLTTHEQEAVSKFYYGVYLALVEYYVARDSVCSCLWEAQLRKGFREQVEQHFIKLNRELRNADKADYD
eukprot:gene4277-4697_t